MDEEKSNDFLERAIKALKSIDPAIALKVLEEIQETQREDSNIVLVGTDAKRTITIIHVDRDALNGEDGPVLFPTSDSRFVLAAVSRNMLEDQVLKAAEMDDENLGDLYWDGFMSDLMQQIVNEHEKNPQTIKLEGEL